MGKQNSKLGQRLLERLFLPGMLVLAVVASLQTYAIGHFRQPKPHIVFLVSEDPDNYEAHKTIPAFAKMIERDHGFTVSVLLSDGPREASSFPGIDVISRADLLVVFCRCLALPSRELGVIRAYLRAGKPLIGLRTANHAFSFRETPAAGHEAWWEFVADVLGCENRGYGPAEAGTEVRLTDSAKDHPILRGISLRTWHSIGNIYLVAPLLDQNTKVLLTGTAESKTEPIAWTRVTADKSKIFYTSLGYPDDFQQEPFRKLLLNGINWALKRK